MPDDLDYVIERLGITKEDVLETAQKYNLPADKALSYTVLLRARTPDLPQQPQALKPGAIKANADLVGMKPDYKTGNAMEALTGGVGGAMSGAMTGGPMGAAIGGVAGAALPLAINKLTDSPGEAHSANRLLDLAGPLVGGGISKIAKLGPTAKSLTNTAANTLMAYLADKTDNEQFEDNAKSPAGRAATTGGLGLLFAPLARQAGRQVSNISLGEKLTKSPAVNANVQNALNEISSYYKEKPKAFGDATRNLIAPASVPGVTKEMVDNPQVKKLLKDSPQQVFDHILSPIIGAKDQAGLKEAAPLMTERLSTLRKLLPGSEKDINSGLTTTFFNSISKSPDGSRISNPDSFRMRLQEIGPEIIDSAMGKDAYEKLNLLSESASKAGALGRFAVRMGDNHMVVAKMVPLDQDSKLTNKAMDLGKMAALASTPVSGKKGLAVAGGLQAYEIYKISIDTLLNKTDKKTLAALSSGLMNSTSNSVINKLTEWFEKNADKKERVPFEGPPQLF